MSHLTIEQQVAVAARTLKVDTNDTRLRHKVLTEDDNALYVYLAVRGPGAVIVAPTGESLFCIAAVPFEAQLSTYRSTRPR